MSRWAKIEQYLERARKAHADYLADAEAVRNAPHMSADEKYVAGAAGWAHLLDPDVGERWLAERRQAAARVIADAMADATAERAAIDRDAAAAAEGPDGLEGVAARVELADAATRVRRLLDAGTPAHVIVDRAAQIGDRATLRALRTEVEWLNLPGADLADEVKHRLGLTPSDGDEGASPVALVAALVRRINRAELSLASGRERSLLEAKIDADDNWPAAEVEFAQLARLEHRSLDDAIALRYARSGPSGRAVEA